MKELTTELADTHKLPLFFVKAGWLHISLGLLRDVEITGLNVYIEEEELNACWGIGDDELLMYRQKRIEKETEQVTLNLLDVITSFAGTPPTTELYSVRITTLLA